jgi:hypothetical protein
MRHCFREGTGGCVEAQVRACKVRRFTPAAFRCLFGEAVQFLRIECHDLVERGAHSFTTGPSCEIVG